MKPQLLYIIILINMVCASCSNRYYAPALYQNDIQYMVKPHSKDSVHTRFYAAGTYLSQGGANGQGMLNSGLLNLYRAHTTKNFNFSYGAIGYAGQYKKGVRDSIMPSASKSYAGYGLNGSASVYTATSKTDYRFGVDLAYTLESGNYLSFRRSVFGQQDVYSYPGDHLFSYGLFTEFVSKISNDINCGVKLFINRTSGGSLDHGINNYSGKSTVGFNFLFGYKQVTARMTTAMSSNLINASTQLGLTYGF